MGDVARGTVLLVDDDEDSRLIFSLVLEHAGYSVVTAARGDEALEKALTERPAVIVSDIGLPGFDGIELLRRLNDTPAAGTPVIAVTGRVMLHEQYRVRAHGFRCVLLKPLAPKLVLQAVDDVLSRRRDGD